MEHFSTDFTDGMLRVFQSMLTIQAHMLEQNDQMDISVSESRLLWKISTASHTLSELAQEMGLTLPSVTVAVQKLEKKGYVIKERSPSDKRVILVSLTPSGKRVAEVYRYVQENTARAASSDFTPEEKAAFLSGLDKLNHYLDQRIEKMEAKK